MSYIPSSTQSYPNANLHIGPIKQDKKKDLEMSNAEKISLIQTYSTHIKALRNYLYFDNPAFEKLEGVEIGPTKKTSFEILNISNEYGNLVAIAIFVNKLLLNVNKLPEAPLVFDGDTVNGLPLRNYVILPSDDLWAWLY